MKGIKLKKCMSFSFMLLFMSSFFFCMPVSAQKIDFIGSARDSFSSLMDEAVPFDEELRHYEAEGGTIDLDVYTSDKIEKIVFSSIQIEETGVSEESVFIYPAAGYEVPVFWANMTRMFGIINILIFDFMPLQDIVMNPDYGQTYLEPLNATKTQVMDEILKRTVRDKAVEFSSLAMYAYSPYKMVAQVSFFGAMRIADVVDAYSATYLNLLENATELAPGDRLDYATEKLAALRELLRTNDPGYPFMVETFGEEVTQRVMDVIF
jgi:hypothetical protein